MLTLIKRVALGFLLLVGAFIGIETNSDPLKRPSFLIWPENKPTFAQINQEPILLNGSTKIKNEWYFYGGATGGSFTLLSVCEGVSCRTLLQAVGTLTVSHPSPNSNLIDVRGMISDQGPSNFTVWYPRRCKPNEQMSETPHSWTCQFRAVKMNLHYVALKPKPRVRYTLEGVPRDKVTETIVAKPKP